MATSVFENEKRIQRMFGLRHRPERFSNKEAALRFAAGCVNPQMVIGFDENPAGIIPAYYVVCPADFSRLEREAEDCFFYVSPSKSL